MEETTNPTTPVSNPAPSTTMTAAPASPSNSDAPHPEKEGSGAVVWVLVSIIVLVILGAGGYYIWSSNQVADVAPAPTGVATPSPTAMATQSAKVKTATDEATADLNTVSSGDDTTSLKKDLDNTNLNNIDKENSDISKEVAQ